MSRRLRIKRKKPTETEMIQGYLDQKVNEAFQPILENLYELQVFADAVHRNVIMLRENIERLPLSHQEAIYIKDQVIQSLREIEQSRYPSYTNLDSLQKEVADKLKTPRWMDDAMREADNMDLSGLIDDD